MFLLFRAPPFHLLLGGTSPLEVSSYQKWDPRGPAVGEVEVPQRKAQALLQ